MLVKLTLSRLQLDFPRATVELLEVFPMFLVDAYLVSLRKVFEL
jgi:hypothetical protein